MNTEKRDIMQAIKSGEIRMRPRWHFLFLSTLSITGAVILFIVLLYIASLIVFFMQDSGTLFTPAFGMRGWMTLIHALPWILIGFIVVFVITLELFVRHFSFIYKKPLILSIAGIIVLVIVGGFLIAPLHRPLMRSAKHGDLPPPLNAIYGTQFRSPREADLYHGHIIAIVQGGFILFDEDDAGTTSVYVTPETRLPYGHNFATGTRIVVIGDQSASGSVRAFGVSQIDE